MGSDVHSFLRLSWCLFGSTGALRGRLGGGVLWLALWLPARAAAQVAPSRPTAAELPSLVRQHQFAAALAAADTLVKANPRTGELWFYRGLALNGMGHPAEAMHDFQHALDLDPHLLSAAEAGAQIAYRDHSPAEAKFLQEVLRLDPPNPTAHAMLGVLALEAGDCPLALDHFAKAGSLASADAATTRRLGLCDAQGKALAGDLDGAAQRLAALHAAEPANAAVALDLASIELAQHHPEQAIPLLEPMRATLSAAGLNLLASAYAGHQELPAAIQAYRDSIARAPLEDTSYLDLATLGMEHQSPEVSLSVLDAGLKAHPGSTRLLVMRGTVYAQLGKDDRAQQDFEQADRLAPSSSFGALGLGVLLREDGNLAQAQAVLEKKLQVTPHDAVLSFLLADVLVRAGAAPGDPAFERALGLLHVAIANQPSLASAHALLGKLELKASHPELAVPELEAAIKLQPTDRTALNQLIAAYRRLGRTADAERTSRVLEASVAADRAQENETNRIHLSLEGSTPSAAPPALPQPAPVAPAATTQPHP